MYNVPTDLIFQSLKDLKPMKLSSLWHSSYNNIVFLKAEQMFCYHLSIIMSLNKCYPEHPLQLLLVQPLSTTVHHADLRKSWWIDKSQANVDSNYRSLLASLTLQRPFCVQWRKTFLVFWARSYTHSLFSTPSEKRQFTFKWIVNLMWQNMSYDIKERDLYCLQ